MRFMTFQQLLANKTLFKRNMLIFWQETSFAELGIDGEGK